MTAACRLAIDVVGPAAPAAKLANSIAAGASAGAVLFTLITVSVAAVVLAATIGACCIDVPQTTAVGCQMLLHLGNCNPGGLGHC